MDDYFPLLKAEHERGFAPGSEGNAWLIAEVERLRRIEDVARERSACDRTGCKAAGKLARVLEFNPRPGSADQ